MLAALIAQSQALFVVTDAQGQVTWASPAFITLCDVALVGAALPDRLAPGDGEDAPALQRRLAEGLRQGHFAITELLLRPGPSAAASADTSVWLRLEIASLGDHRLWTLQDVTADRAEQARTRRLEELLDTAQEFGRLGVWERDIATGRGRWDEHVFRYWGLDPTQGTPSFDAAMAQVHQDDRHTAIYLESTRQPGRYSQRYRVIGPDGGQRWIHSQWEVKATPAGVPSHAVGVMVDDTEVIALARSLDDASAHLTLAVELGQIAIWRLDLRSGRVSFNARGFEVLGMPFRAQGLSIDEVRSRIHPDDLQAVMAAGREALQSDAPTDMEARYRASDGRWRHMLTRRVLHRDAQGQPQAFIGVALDISERRLSEQALRQVNERVALATQGAGIGTWEHDLVTDEVRWDAQMYLLRGLQAPTDPHEARIEPDKLRRALAHPEEMPLLFEANRRSLAQGTMASYEFRVRQPDGSYRWLASRSIPVYDAHGKAVRQLGVNWDIHDSISAEAVRREALALQRQSEAKAQFLARMSHELRTPLNAILGFTHLLEFEAQAPSHAALGAPDPQRAKLRFIREASEHLLGLVNEVLDLSSIDAGELQVRSEPVSLDALMAEVLAEVGPLAQARDVRLRAQTAGFTVLADRERLRQVLVKLLGHRVRMMAAGCEVHVQVQAAGDGADAELGISDNGRGLTPAQQLNLFEPFGRIGAGNGEEPDNGVNLALVKALMACMNGRVEVAGTPGQGTRFTLRLPQAAAATPGVAATLARSTRLAPKDEADSTPPGSGTVLYIEDNLVNVILVEELIAQRGGLELVCEPTGAAGVARALALQPDLVLIDMQLPDFDGFEVLRRLRADPVTAASNCIALSANAMPDDVARALAAGFDDYWTKPIRFNSFLAGLDKLFPKALAPR